MKIVQKSYDCTDLGTDPTVFSRSLPFSSFDHHNSSPLAVIHCLRHLQHLATAAMHRHQAAQVDPDDQRRRVDGKSPAGFFHRQVCHCHHHGPFRSPEYLY